MKVIHFDIDDDDAFDDQVAFDCIVECMRERIDDSEYPEDQKVMRKWLRSLYRVIGAYEDAYANG